MRRHLPLALALGACAGLLAATQPISDTDMWWHLATGRETLAHGFVRSDLFSWTVGGAPVTTDQWLGQVLLWLSYLGFGFHGVAVLRVLLVTALIALVALSASRATARPLAVVLATMPALLVTRAVWVDRPELFGFVLFGGLLLLLRLGRAGSDRALAGAVVVILAWTNIHGSFALGVVLAALVCAEGALHDAPRRRSYVACAIAAITVTVANPAGLGAWTAPGSHLLSPPRDIQEWNVIDVRTALGVAYVITFALVIACAFLGPRLAPSELVLLVPVALLSLTAVRQAPLLAIVAAPLFSSRVQPAIERLVRAGTGTAAGSFGRAVAAAVAVLLLVAAVLIAPERADERAYPAAIAASIPTGDGTLARYEWGGWLIWRGIPVFVDGRLTPFRGAVLDDYQRIIAAEPGWEDIVRARHVGSLLVGAADPVAVRAMELGWRVVARSDDVVLITVP